MRYLVDVVWGAQSALSAWDSLHDLSLVRWEQLWEWSPWNCILLTKNEAAAHLKVDSIEKVTAPHSLSPNSSAHLDADPQKQYCHGLARVWRLTNPGVKCYFATYFEHVACTHSTMSMHHYIQLQSCFKPMFYDV